MPAAKRATVSGRNPYSKRKYVPRGSGVDPKKSAERSARRRRNKIEEFLVANRLTRMWTLTYAVPVDDFAQVKRDIRAFVKRLRQHLGENFPYLWVIEWHKSGDRLHVHMALRADFISKAAFERLWGQGLVQYQDRRVRKGCRQGRAELTGAALAAYLAKSVAGYLSKDSERSDGTHFYEPAQGYQPEAVADVFEGDDQEVVTYLAGKYFGGELPSDCWRSWETVNVEPDREWEGPDVISLRWYGVSRG